MDENKDLSENYVLESKKFFFLGICGIGMSALAQYIKKNISNTVIGSDIDTNNEMNNILGDSGITVIPQSEINADIIDKIDILVLTNILFSTNHILELAKKKNKIIIQRSKLLKKILKNKQVIGISGSHGKTTTTGLTVKIFKDAGHSPLGFIGGIMPEFKNNFVEGDSSLAIVEADEAFKSFLDLDPFYAVITTISVEHLETYKNLTDIENNFLTFIDKIPKNGVIIVNIDSEAMKKFHQKIQHPQVITYGTDPSASFCIKNILLEKKQSLFDLYRNNQKIASFSLSLPGIHNIKNATASIILGIHHNIPLLSIQQSLMSHRGVKRRFEFIGTTAEGICVYDDYGHHPEEIDATLSILEVKEIKKVYLFFQLHRYSRTEELWNNFIDTFEKYKEKIACLYTTDIYSAGELPRNKSITGSNFAFELNQKGILTKYFPAKSNFEDFLIYKNDIKNARDKEKIIILTLGAGKMNNFASLITKSAK